MIILWIRKRKADKHDLFDKKENQSFQKHDEIMKRFRLEHEDVSIINPRDILAGEENLLAPIQQVKLPENIQN